MTELDRLEIVFLLGCAAGLHCGRKEQQEVAKLADELKEAAREEGYLRGCRDALKEMRARLRATGITIGCDDETESDPAARLN